MPVITADPIQVDQIVAVERNGVPLRMSVADVAPDRVLLRWAPGPRVECTRMVLVQGPRQPKNDSGEWPLRVFRRGDRCFFVAERGADGQFRIGGVVVRMKAIADPRWN